MSEGALVRTLRSQADTIRLAQEISPRLRSGDVVLLSGGLGVGKTFLSREILYALGLPRSEEVPSPTFLLLQAYALPTMRVLHADFYRLRESEDPETDVRRLGLDEALGEGALLLLEWGDGFEISEGHALRVQLDRAGDAEDTRTVRLSGPLAHHLSEIDS